MTFRLITRRALLTALVFTSAVGWPATGPSEYQVKAVFLFNFGQFVEWPANAYDTPQAPFVIGILGEDPFGNSLDQVVRGESVGSRPLQVRRFKSPGEIRDCNILFIGRNESDQLRAALEAVRGRSVLTVTDIDGADSHGAIIVLFNENNRIRMRINLAAAKASQLVISSKLLRPAVVVGTEGA